MTHGIRLTFAHAISASMSAGMSPQLFFCWSWVSLLVSHSCRVALSFWNFWDRDKAFSKSCLPSVTCEEKEQTCCKMLSEMLNVTINPVCAAFCRKLEVNFKLPVPPGHCIAVSEQWAVRPWPWGSPSAVSAQSVDLFLSPSQLQALPHSTTCRVSIQGKEGESVSETDFVCLCLQK